MAKGKRKSIQMIPDMMSSIIVARDYFTSSYERILEEHEENEKQITLNYIGAKKAEMRQVEQDSFDQKLQSLRSEFTDAINKSTGEVERELNKEISSPFTLPMFTNLLTSGMPVTESELKVMYAENGGSYWLDKLFSTIADKNGIQGIEFPASADVVYAVLDSIRSEADDLSKNWKGEKETGVMERMLLHDTRLNKWTETATKGIQVTFTPEQKAQRYVSTMQQATAPFEKLVAFHNVMRNLDGDEDTKQLVLYQVAHDDKLYNTSLIPYIGSDYKKQLEAYHNGEKAKPVPKEEAEQKEVLTPEEKKVAVHLSQTAKQMDLAHSYASGDASAE